MKNGTIFTGAATALITPLTAEGVDYEAYGKLIDWQIEEGIDALVIAGTTGEGSTLTYTEHQDAIRYAAERAAGRVPIIAGSGSNDTNRAIAESVDRPIILYNVPSRTGVNIEPATYAALAEIPNIAAIKEANGNISKIVETRALVGDALDIYSGNDDQIVPILSMGGAGVISVLSNVMPRQTSRLCKRFFEGDLAGSAKMQCELLPLIQGLFSEVNPIPVKAAMAAMGWCENYVRLPLTPMEDAHWQALRAEMVRQGLL